MKERKGFTLIEIIAAVIILGIISIIAVITYTNSMQEFRESYYVSLERSLTESGKEFFNDNRNYRPTSIFAAQKVPISILEAKSYIDDIIDYTGKKCDKSSYVIAIKTSKNDYVYHTCLVCSEDTYSNLEDKYCDSVWDDATTVRPSLEEFDDLYVYKNTSQEKLRNKLLASVSITKYDRNGNIIETADGDGVDGVPQILPENIDVVDTSKIGTYIVTYKYNNKSVDRRVHVYENSEPEVVITKTNKYAKTIVEDGVTEDTKTTVYSSGDWAQDINLSFTPGSNFYSESGQKVSQYQWNKDGKWQKICDSIGADGSCTLDYRTEMNEEIAFRVVDTEGNISKETTTVVIRIDRTNPTCTLTKEGTPGVNDWFHSNVIVKFDTIKDQQSMISEAKSGIGFNSIRRGVETYSSSSRTNNVSLQHTDESQYVWYYGFVEDKAQNYATCSTKLRKDTVAPSCTITGHATLNCSDATSNLVKVYFGKDDNSSGGTALNREDTWSGTGTVDSTGVWYLKATDHSGNTYQTFSNYYLVTYNKNGGDADPAKTSEIKRETESADLSQVVRREGYRMIGWHTSSTSTTALSTYTVNSNVTLYAIYIKCAAGYHTNTSGKGCEANTYTVTYKANGGSGADQIQTVTFDAAWKTKAAVFTRTGFTQTGWSTSASGTITHNLDTDQGAYKTVGNLTLYATWRANCSSGYTYQSNGTCLKTYTATTNYSCNSGDSRSGTTCYHSTTYGATYTYSGGCSWVDDGCHGHFSKNDIQQGVGNKSDMPECTGSNGFTGTIKCGYDYPSGTYYKWHDCGKGKHGKVNAAGTGYNCSNNNGDRYTYKESVCKCSGTGSYSCNSGDSLSGSTCTHTTTYTATTYYTCNSGDSLNGTTCTSVYTP